MVRYERGESVTTGRGVGSYIGGGKYNHGKFWKWQPSGWVGTREVWAFAPVGLRLEDTVTPEQGSKQEAAGKTWARQVSGFRRNPTSSVSGFDWE